MLDEHLVHRVCALRETFRLSLGIERMCQTSDIAYGLIDMVECVVGHDRVVRRR